MKTRYVMCLFILSLSLFSITWSQESPVTKLKQEHNVTKIVLDKTGIPTFIEGDLTPKGVQGDEKEKTYKFFEENRDLFKMVDPRNELQIARTTKDELGMTHIRLNQLYKGVKVYGSELITHFSSSGKLKSINGKYLSGIIAPISPRIGKTEAEGIALSNISSNLKNAKPESLVTQLIIYPFQDTIYLAWLIKINVESPPGRWEYFLNATDGTVIHKANRIMNEGGRSSRLTRNKTDETVKVQEAVSDTDNDAIGTGIGVLGDTKNHIDTYGHPGLYNLEDHTRRANNNPHGHNGQMRSDQSIETRKYLDTTAMTDEDNVWDTSSQASGVDAHVYAGLTYDFLLTQFARNSFDNNGSSMLSIVDRNDDLNNVYWDGSKVVYSVVSSGNRSFAGAIDMVAHDWAHGVTQYESRLIYEKESGALNESFSDMMGIAVGFGTGVDPDWQFSENFFTDGTAWRDLSNPHLYNQPDTYLNDTYWVDVVNCNPDLTNDYCGVHINSGVPNKAFYLLSQGGTHNGMTVTGIGISNAIKIMYRANANYWTRNTNFEEAKQGCISAANDLDATGNWALQTRNAWEAVGVESVQLVSPADSAINQPITVSLSWTAAARATSYRLQVATSPLFSSLVLDDSTLTATSRQVGPLAYDSTYYWRVSASNIGGTSPYSSVRRFTTIVKAPSTPSLASPEDAAINQSITVTLQWNAAPRATRYQVQVSTTPSFSSMIVDDSTLTTTSRQVGALEYDRSYYWRVRAENVGGISVYSPIRQFTTIVEAPLSPVLVSPADSAINQPIVLSLSWTATARATSYRLQVATSPLFSTLIFDDSTLTATTRELGPLAYDSAYYWRVSAANIGGTSPYSSVRRFTTIVEAPLPPLLISPEDGAINQPITVTLAWNAAPRATQYRVQVSTSPSFIPLQIDDSTLTTTSLTVALGNDTTYYWRVRAENVGGISAYSPIRQFTTTVEAPPSPTLVSPADSAINQPITVSLSWTIAARATQYRLQVATSPLFSSLVLDDSTLTATTRQLGSLLYDSTYYWRVSAVNIGGTSPYSSVRRFTTIVEAPLPPLLISPEDGAINQPITVTLAWNAAQRATRYRVQVSITTSFSSTVVDDSTLTTTSRQVGALEYDRAYYWRARAENVGGISAYSSIRQFTTIVEAPPSPALVSPADSAINQPITVSLSWTTAARATSYRLQVATSPLFSPLVLDDSTLTAMTRELGPLAYDSTYYWWVSASNIGGTSPYSPVRRFTAIVEAPLPPLLVSPEDGAINQPITVTLQWNAASRATRYRIQVSATPSFSLMIVDDSTLTTTSRQVGVLEHERSYYWRVRAENVGGISAYSPIRQFTTIVEAPLSPTLVSPADSAVNQPIMLSLSWTAAARATSYHVQVSTSLQFNALVVDDSTLTATTRQLGSLLYDSTYYWRVSAVNIGGTSPYSSVRHFTTIVEAPPSPVLLSPEDGAINQPITVTLAWNAAPRASQYRVQVSTSPSFVSTVVDDSTLTTTSRQVGPLEYERAYYWRVRAENVGGISAYSSIRQFTTIVEAPPSPALVSPGDSAINQPIMLSLSWTAAARATSYHVQVSTSLQFNALVVDDSTLTATTRQLGSLLYDSTYYWRVSAVNIGGTSPYSSVRHFTTIVEAPPSPTLLAPTDGSENTPRIVTLQWNVSPRAARYRVQVSTSSSFSSTVVDDSTLTTTSRQVGPLEHERVHYWRVQAENVGGISAYSSIRQFTTIIEAPPSPALVSPADSAINQPITLSLSWTTDTRATRYRLQVATGPLFSSLVLDDSTLTAATRELGPLAYDSAYYWRVSAVNIGGTSPYSSVRRFTTIVEAPLSPVLLTPTDSSENTPRIVTLQWNVSPRAMSYHLQVSPTPEFNSLVIDDSVPPTDGITSRRIGPLNYNSTYYWRVKGANIGGTSPYSLPRRFTVIAPPPSVQALTVTPSVWTASNSFVISWVNPSTPLPVNKVLLKIGTPPTSDTDTTATRTGLDISSIQISAPARGQNLVHIWLADVDGNTYFGNYRTVTLKFDDLKPSISGIVLPDSAVAGQDIVVGATANDAHAGVASFRLFVRESGRGWSEATSILFSNGIVFIPSGSVAPSGIDYMMIAVDSAGNADTLKNGLLSFRSVSLAISPLHREASIVFPTPVASGDPERGVLDFRLVSIPLALTNSNAAAVFQDAGGYGSDWQLITFQGGNNPLLPGPEVSSTTIQILPGNAYFLSKRFSKAINTGGGKTIALSEVVKNGIPLRAGYNFVGNPFMFDIPVSSFIFSNNQSLNNVWYFSGSSEDPWRRTNVVLEKYSGIVVHASSPSTLRFSNPDNPVGQTAHHIVGKQTSQESDTGWVLTLEVQGAVAKTTYNSIGVLPRATDLYDEQYDIYSPPIMPGLSALYFRHTDWPDSGFFATDLRSPTTAGHTWDAALIDKPGRQVKILVHGVSSIPSGFKAYAIVLDSKMVFDLVRDSVMTFNSGSGTRLLRFLVGTASQSSGVPLVPTEFAVRQNYPNPFNSTTTIRYELPTEGRIRIILFNILGESVATLLDEDKPAGYHEIPFTANSLASGVYFYRIEFVSPGSSHRIVKKMLLLK